MEKPGLYLKEFIKRKIFFIWIVIASTVPACTSYNAGSESIRNETNNAALQGAFNLPQQVAPPPEIQSIQLHPQGEKAAAPVIKLNGSKPLTLEFDDLADGIRQFRLSVSHRSKNWKESPIGPTIYLGSFFETYFGNSKQSYVQNPSYHHYKYNFPNERFTITKSGNYLLSVFDDDSNNLLFKIPFFISEDKGQLATRIETLFAQRNDAHTLAQPFSEYQYPGFVQQPQFDLSFAYIQNQFWGRTRQTNLFDTATQGSVHFHLGREQSFIGDYEFNLLEASSFQPNGRQIIEYQPGKVPSLVTLRRDIQLFDTKPGRYAGPVLGLPRDDLRAQYGTILFSLEPENQLPGNTQLYLTGDFNNWMIDEQYRMRFDSTASLWQTKALVKQGTYAYKYVLIDGQTIDDLTLDRSFVESRQEYLTFVYFRDPQQRFDRLLKVDRTLH